MLYLPIFYHRLNSKQRITGKIVTDYKLKWIIVFLFLKTDTFDHTVNLLIIIISHNRKIQTAETKTQTHIKKSVYVFMCKLF